MIQNYKKGGKVKRKVKHNKNVNVSQVVKVNINLGGTKRRRNKTMKKSNTGSLDKYKPVITKNETFLKASPFIGSSNVSPYLLIDQNRRDVENKTDNKLLERLLKEIDDRNQKQADDIIKHEKDEEIKEEEIIKEEEEEEIREKEIKADTLLDKLDEIYGPDNVEKINSVFNFLKKYYSGKSEKEILKFIRNIYTSEDMAKFIMRKQKQKPWKI